MSVEVEIFQALCSLVADRVYPDLAPDAAMAPYIVYQQVGGAPINFLDHALPSKRNSRFQVVVWAAVRTEAAVLSEAAERALRSVAALQTTVLGQPVASHDAATELRGARQDFSFWY